MNEAGKVLLPDKQFIKLTGKIKLFLYSLYINPIAIHIIWVEVGMIPLFCAKTFKWVKWQCLQNDQ